MSGEPRSERSAPSDAEHTVTASEAGFTLAKVVRGQASGMTWNRARDLCRSGRVDVDGRPLLDDAARLQPGQRVRVRAQAPRLRGGVLHPDAIVHVDRELVVVDKPAGLLTVPYSDGDRDTLVDITRARLRRRDPHGGAELGVVQRLDKETSGVLVFARSLAAKRKLQQQWRVHAIERRYWALVHGVPKNRRIETQLVRDRGDGLRGSYGHFRRPQGPPPRDAQRAETHIRVLSTLGDCALVECRLMTGRQHQIRIHLSELGHPLLGERVYIRDYPEPPQRGVPRIMLHARVLGLSHPRSGEALRFERPPPEDFTALLDRLSKRAGARSR